MRKNIILFYFGLKKILYEKINILFYLLSKKNVLFIGLAYSIGVSGLMNKK